MGHKLDRLGYIVSTAFFGLLAVLFMGVLITSLAKNAIDIWVRVGWDWRHPGNYVGLTVGFIAYLVPLALTLIIPRFKHNLAWMLKFTHELTHTLVALLFFRKIHEFVIKDGDCYASSLPLKIKDRPITFGYVPITLSPYCIPIFTFMLFPFRFAGDGHYMIVFDALIAFTYAFHVHAFIMQTRYYQSDIENCGKARSTAFIAFVHAVVMALILAIPKGGVLKALNRVFCEYPWQILTDPSGWFHEIIKFF